jgi:hypothetical protein
MIQLEYCSLVIVVGIGDINIACIIDCEAVRPRKSASDRFYFSILSDPADDAIAVVGDLEIP